MKKLILATLALFSFSITPIKAIPWGDIAVGLASGTSPIIGHVCLYGSLSTMKPEAARKRFIMAVPSSLVGTWFWYKSAEYLRDKYELEKLSYVIPALPFSLFVAGFMAGIKVADMLPSQTNSKH